MRCINKITRFISCILIPSLILVGCGTKDYSFSYDRERSNSGFSVAATLKGESLDAFASNLCIATGDVDEGTDVDMSMAVAAGLFDVNDSSVIYGKNIHEKLNPASTTKILTALCALEYGNLDDVITATENVYITESGAVMLGVQKGDTMTLDQALHALLLKSANDVAVMVAEHIGGSVEGFSTMMNEMANRLGATNSHFVNPHGYQDKDHYTTAYDLYLIFNECIKNEAFLEIVSSKSYSTVIAQKNGTSRNVTWGQSNLFVTGARKTPRGITLIGGKTGNTYDAGSCLVMYGKDSADTPYISIIMGATSRRNLYDNMTFLWAAIP